MGCWVRFHDARIFRTEESIMRPEEGGWFSMIHVVPVGMMRSEWDGKQPNHCISDYCKTAGVVMAVCTSFNLLYFS